MWNGRLVGWSVGRLPAWLADSLAGLLARLGSRVWREHRRCVCRALARVLRTGKRPHAGETRCLRAHTRERGRTRVTYASFRSLLYERSIFWGQLFGGFAAGARRSVFLSRQWRNFHYNGAVIVPVVRRSSGGKCARVYAECRFRVRANIWHEVLGLREARRNPQLVAFGDTCFGVIVS